MIKIGYVGSASENRFIFEATKAVCQISGFEIAFASDHLPDCDISLCLYDARFKNNRFGMPNKLYAALKAGVPSIVCTGSIASYFVRERLCGVCCEYTIESFRSCILNLSGTEIVKMSLNAVDAYDSNYNWGIDKEKLLNLYRRLQ